jgi:uncharacterized protein (DUF58 family)
VSAPAGSRTWIAAGRRAGSGYRLRAGAAQARGGPGARPGTLAGVSVELLDHREYLPGDDLRHLDWNASARRERPVLKLLREEVSPSVDLIMDGSRSMGLDGTPKAGAMLGLAALLAAAARATGWSCRCWYTGSACHRLEPTLLEPTLLDPSQRDPAGPSRDTARPEVWPDGLLASPVNPGDALATGSGRWACGGIRILISDLMWPGDPAPVLHQLARGASLAAVIRLAARADLEPPAEGALRLVDAESGSTLELAMDAGLRQSYLLALGRHESLWRSSARRLGVMLTGLVADELVRGWQVDPLIEHGLLEVAP